LYNRAAAYDINKKFIEINGWFGLSGESLFHTPPKAAYILFYVSTTTYNHDICLNLSHSGRRNGEYEAYWDSELSVPVTTLTGKKDGEGSSVVVFPDGLKRVGSVYDEIKKVGNQTVAIKRVGSVDLGTLTWDKNVHRFVATPSPAGMAETWNNNIICSKYKVEGSMNTSDIYYAIGLSNGSIYVSEDSETAAAVKDKLDGVIAYYALATPEEYVLDDFDLPQHFYVDDWGTEEVVPVTGQVTSAPTLSIEYGVNAPDAIRNLPRNYVSAKEQQTFTEMQMRRARYNIGLDDLCRLGCGLGTCTTAASTAAKEVSIPNFLLVKHGEISVFFDNAVSVADATLNVSGSGAKPIKLNGVNLQPNVIRPRMMATMKYDGSNWCVTALAGMEQTVSPDDLWVDMGLPSGLKWAKRNIDVTQANGFAASEYQYECSFVSWGNTNMKNPSSSSAFAETWGTANDTEPYVSSPGAALTGNIAPSMDAARVNLGAPWRMPTTGEYAELFANIDYIDADGNAIDSSQANKLVTMNSITGIRIKSKVNGNILFFPCSGHGNGTSWNHSGSYGRYWASSLYSSTDGRHLHFYSGGVYPQGNNTRYYGFAVRAVQ
jgi:hypothetical protein